MSTTKIEFPNPLVFQKHQEKSAFLAKKAVPFRPKMAPFRPQNALFVQKSSKKNANQVTICANLWTNGLFKGNVMRQPRRYNQNPRVRSGGNDVESIMGIDRG